MSLSFNWRSIHATPSLAGAQSMLHHHLLALNPCYTITCWRSIHATPPLAGAQSMLHHHLLALNPCYTITCWKFVKTKIHCILRSWETKLQLIISRNFFLLLLLLLLHQHDNFDNLESFARSSCCAKSIKPAPV